MTERNIGDILREHAVRYPKMQPRDAVKLLYQANFGPGHLIKDAASATLRIREEQLTADTSLSPAIENIGHGYVRVYLHPDISAEVLGERFAASAIKREGSREAFLEDLAVLRKLTEEGVLSFSPAKLDEYVERYLADGIPIVSHSKEYKEAYKPAYRVVLACLADDILTNK